MQLLRPTALFALLLVFSGALSGQKSAVSFRDEFQDNSQGWTLVENENVKATIDGGKMRIEHFRTSGSSVIWNESMQIFPENNFYIETTLKHVEGTENQGFGFVWGATDPGNFYGFNITGDGKYRVYGYHDMKYVSVQPYTFDKNILPTGKTNRVGIRKFGNMLSFYLNDQYLFETPAQKFFGNKIGFVVYKEMTVEIDQLAITQEKQLDVSFRETFEKADRDWMRGNDEGQSLKIADGKFFLTCKSEDEPVAGFKDIPIDAKKDFEVESHLTQLSGDDEGGYGMVLGWAGTNDSYVFIVSSDGTYMISLWNKGIHSVVQDWTDSQDALKPLGGENKLTVRKSGNYITFYANDRFLHRSRFRNFPISKIGFVVYDAMQVAVEDFTLREGDPDLDAIKASLEWESPKLFHSTTEEGTYQVKAKVRSATDLTSVNLYVNNQMVSGEFKSVEKESYFEGWLLRDVQLNPGKNQIKITAQNQVGAFTSETRTVILDKEKAAVSLKGKDYALFFATNEYEEWNDLGNPVNDSRTIAGELEKNYGFEVELVENASRATVLSKLKDYARRDYEPGDQLMIFFAGHGKFDDIFGEGYVVCANSAKVDDGNTTYISHSTLRTIINNIPVRHLFLAMDVCFGGTIDPFIAQASHRGGDGGFKEMSQVDYINRKMKFKTRKYLTSGGKEYVPDGTPGQHSPFARKFLQALRSYGGEDRVLTLGELILYFERMMPEPRFGEFGTNEPGSDFLFVAK